jgi:DHA3 family macrolide efflux protein-like MFS transporter
MLGTFRLLRNRNFLLTWFSSIAEGCALAILMLSTTWYVVDVLQMKSRLGWIMIAGSVPRLLLMTAGGVFADRMRKTHIMTLTFGLRVVIVGAGALLFWQGAMSLIAVLISGVLFSVVDAFFWPARDALLPSIVDDADLTKANSIMQATNWICMTVAPMLGGALLSLLPFHGIYLFIVVLLAAGAILISQVHERGALPGMNQALLHDMRDGIRFVFVNPALRTLLLIYVIANFLFVGPANLGPPIIASEHPTIGPAGLSYMLSGFGLGMMCGFVTMMAFPPTHKRLFLILAVITVEGMLLAMMGRSANPWLLVILQFMMGLCIACNNVPMLSLIQESTERDKLGRVMSLVSVSSMGLSPISYAMVSALLSAGVSIGIIMPVLGLTMSLMMLLIGARNSSVVTA